MTQRSPSSHETDLIVQGLFRLTAGKVRGRHQIPVIHRVTRPDARRRWRDDRHSDRRQLRGGCGPAGLFSRHDLVATLDRGVGRRVTIISAPASSAKMSLLHAWAD
jgi:hypothetical protein